MLMFVERRRSTTSDIFLWFSFSDFFIFTIVYCLMFVGYFVYSSQIESGALFNYICMYIFFISLFVLKKNVFFYLLPSKK